MSSHPVVVGLLYPAAWDGADPGALAGGGELLRAVDPRVCVVDCRTDPGALAQVEVALAMTVPDDARTSMPALRWVQGVGAGVAPIVEATDGVRVTSAAGVNAASVAEFALARVLEWAKRLPSIGRAQSEGEWRPAYGRELAGLTIGVIGLGAIGSAIARRAAAFDLTVIGVRRDVRAPLPDGVSEVVAPADLHATLARCDVVVAAVPETPDTVGLMNAAAFAAMRAGAFFVNVGRGSLVDEDALVAALVSGHLGGAALDVTRTEPLPADSPLWSAPRLAISAHCAATATGHFARVYRLFADNLARYLDDRPLHNEVDLGRGY